MKALNWALTLTLVLSTLSCKSGVGNILLDTVKFNVGFEELKTHQGVYVDRRTGEEQIYFVKSEFKPKILFYDLKGVLRDSISLSTIEKNFGRVGRVSLISKDSIVVISYQGKAIVGINRAGDYLFKKSFEELNKPNDDKYNFYGSLFPGVITAGGDLFCSLCWQSRESDDSKGMTAKLSRFEQIKEYILNYDKAPQLCKIDSLFGKSSHLSFALANYYSAKSPLPKQYYLNFRYAILNNRLLYTNTFDRNLYVIDLSTLSILDTIPVISAKYMIPESIEYSESNQFADTTAEEFKEIKAKGYVANILYNAQAHHYYVFVKTGLDKSQVDELGYPFKVIVFDESFHQIKEVAFDTDEYNPKSAMMTSKGIFIEKTIKGEDNYGKKTFEVFTL